MKLIFSQNSIFHLYRLGLVVSGETGKKYRLSNSKEMESLIRYCKSSTNNVVCRHYDTFLGSLEPDMFKHVEKLSGETTELPPLGMTG